MDFSRRGVGLDIQKTSSWTTKFGIKILLFVIGIILVCMLLLAAIGISVVVGSAKGIADTSPALDEVAIAPKGLATTIYDTSGAVIQTLIGSGANRSLITYEDLPQDLINAYVAIEDERFWTHEGIDVKGIVRAAFVGVANGFNFTEGASTITQQLIKNNVLGGGSEKTVGARFVRKIQEQYLAVQLEEVLSKEQILVNYLNTINLGAGCLGVEKAAEKYFNKNVSELTLSECAVIAGITQNPYGYNPIRFPEKNATRREKVLRNMEEQGYITAAQREEALADDVYERIAEVQNTNVEEAQVYTYFVDRLINDVTRDLQEKAGYSEEQAVSMLYSGGLHIYTTQDPAIQSVVDEEVSNPENYAGVTSKFSFTYSLRIVHADGSATRYTESNVKKFDERTYLEYDSQEEINTLVAAFKQSVLSTGDSVAYENLDITLQPQVSLTVMDQSTGEVKAIAGGRGEKTASLSLNRATNTFRQPGSTFKVLAAFAPALEYQGATLATTYYDEEYVVANGTAGDTWTPKNWYSSNKYAGYATIRQAITYSMNIVAVRCLVEDVGPSLAFATLEKFGINTLIPEDSTTKVSGRHDVRATLALGGITQGVTNMQLTAAYAALANKGTYIEPILYTKILDDQGQVIIDNTPETHTVVSEDTAYLLTSAMADSMERSSLNGLFDSNSPEAKLSNLPAAGKSGTTNSYNDLWFVGYSPYYTMGIWGGFDDNYDFEKDSNRDFHKTIWRKVMERITADLPYKEFERPSNLVEVEICTKSGKLATDACRADGRECIVRKEIFVSGTEPTEACDIHYTKKVCMVSNLLASETCAQTHFVGYVKLPENSNGQTDDSSRGAPRAICTLCTGAATSETNADGTPIETVPETSAAGSSSGGTNSSSVPTVASTENKKQQQNN